MTKEIHPKKNAVIIHKVDWIQIVNKQAGFVRLGEIFDYFSFAFPKKS